MSCIIQCFIGHPTTQRTITYNSHNLTFSLILIVIAGSHAQGRRNGSRGVSHPKGVIFTFRSLWKTTDPSVLSIGMENFSSSGKNFMAIGLVTHIPDNLVEGSIKNMVKGNSKFYHPKTGTKVTRIGRYDFNDVMTKFRAELS